MAGCRYDIQDMPYYRPLTRSDFFQDTRSSRPLMQWTVARGNLRDDKYFYSGMVGKEAGNEMPFAVTQQVLERGRERYGIYCTPCHSATGNGDGMIVLRGYRRPPSFHVDRLRKSPVGHFYDVMTNGFGAMPDYSAQVQPRDRWAIAAYIRALQLSQAAPADAIPAGAKISGAKLPPAPPDTGAVTNPSAAPLPGGQIITPGAQQAPATQPGLDQRSPMKSSKPLIEGSTKQQ